MLLPSVGSLSLVLTEAGERCNSGISPGKFLHSRGSNAVASNYKGVLHQAVVIVY